MQCQPVTRVDTLLPDLRSYESVRPDTVLPGVQRQRWASYGNIVPGNKSGPGLSREDPRHQRQLREKVRVSDCKVLLWFLARSLNT